MELFLKAKHWQLFLFNFAIPFFLFLLGIVFMIGVAASRQFNDPDFPFLMIPFFVGIGLLASAVQYLWTWAAGINLNKRLPEELRLNTTLFKVCFFYPIFFALFFILLFLISIYPEPGFKLIYLLLIPFHLFSVFCSFYCYYFVARVIKTNEMDRYTSISDYIAEIFMVWFFFIGIWFLQPKINKIISESDNQEVTGQ
ncbi:MAG: hypothetical protein V2I47_03480 [Bacteroidales bacterium]|jgi:hypothetical protein|nr:hypothetical protein [Bacteroidales bacterium]